MNILDSPYPIFYNTDGSPLSNGYVYIGTENLNPETNPITPYWDSANTIPAINPLRTLNGFIVNNGNAAKIYIPVNYSMTVKDINKKLVSFNPSNGTTSSTAPTATVPNTTSFKNKFLNGDMRFDRTNLGAVITPTGSGNILDYFYATLSQSSKLTFQQVADAPPGFYYSEKVTVLAQYNSQVTDQFLFSQNIVGRDIVDFGLGTLYPATITASIKVKTSVAGVYSCSLSNLAGNRCYIGTVTIIAANVWQDCAITLVADNSGTWPKDSTTGLIFSIDLGCGSNFNITPNSWVNGAYKRTASSVTFVNQSNGSTFQTTGFQIEKSSSMTDFDFRPYNVEQYLIDGLPTIPPTSASIRQTVQYGAVTTAGIPSALAAGSGLALNLAATATPLNMTFAQGFNSTGTPKDSFEQLAADATEILTCPAYNNSFVYRDAATAWGETLAPPQYGGVYNQTAQSCLSLNNISTDDFGNTWTNTSVTFSNATPAIAGTYMGVFNGSSSYMRSTNFTSLGQGGWTLRCKFKTGASIPAESILNAGNTSGYGVSILTAASKLTVYLSSNGSSTDIATGTTGTSTLAINTSYDLEITFDAVSGKYFLYLNGTSEITPVVSSLRICSISNITIGATSAASPANFYTGSIQGFEFLPYCAHPNGTTFTPPTTLANVAAAGYASDWFDTNAALLKSVSAASSSAGVNPTFTSKARVYAGEAITTAGGFSSVTTYNYNLNRMAGSLGYGQTLQSVTRVIGATYYNPTGKPIYVYANGGTGSILNAYWNVQINGVTVMQSSASPGTNAWLSVGFIVPPGCSYSLIQGYGTTPIAFTYEMR